MWKLNPSGFHELPKGSRDWMVDGPNKRSSFRQICCELFELRASRPSRRVLSLSSERKSSSALSESLSQAVFWSVTMRITINVNWATPRDCQKGIARAFGKTVFNGIGYQTKVAAKLSTSHSLNYNDLWCLHYAPMFSTHTRGIRMLLGLIRSEW